ncbi:MAG: DUF5024 domain-containing protein [Phocaeicola sp.]|uniref:DUF5024 domain-containing protein n=1 Tax=Phocaeicola TaxID=909656 RepID=UPI00234EF562|nr:DUF5024 domain-containing protein [Phocaeicola oris]MCE2615627.1 DUF5024 domain-containing protein [Phocaeicola oris]
MKANKLFLAFMAVGLLSLGSITKVMAQQRIDKIVDELEKKGVNVNTVVKRNAKKEVYFTSKTLTFVSKEGNYARQLEEAFDKDGENATTVTKNKSGSSAMTYTLVFKDKKKSIYVMTISGAQNNPTVVITVSCRDRTVQADKDDWKSELFDFSDGTSLILPKTMDSVSHVLEGIDFNKFKFSDEMKKGFDDALNSINKIDWNDLKQKINDAFQKGEIVCLAD